MRNADIISAMEPVVAALAELDVPYAIGGSVASSACGVPRTTLDVDVVAALQPEHVRPFTERLRDKYYLDADAMTEAITRWDRSVKRSRASRLTKRQEISLPKISRNWTRLPIGWKMDC